MYFGRSRVYHLQLSVLFLLRIRQRHGEEEICAARIFRIFTFNIQYSGWIRGKVASPPNRLFYYSQLAVGRCAVQFSDSSSTSPDPVGP